MNKRMLALSHSWIVPVGLALFLLCGCQPKRMASYDGSFSFVQAQSWKPVSPGQRATIAKKYPKLDFALMLDDAKTGRRCLSVLRRPVQTCFRADAAGLQEIRQNLGTSYSDFELVQIASAPGGQAFRYRQASSDGVVLSYAFYLDCTLWLFQFSSSQAELNASLESSLKTMQSLDISMPSLSAARSSFKSELKKTDGEKLPAEKAPESLFETVHYPASVGPCVAYLSKSKSDGKRHPAIIWLTGGDSASIGDVWTEQPAKNEQSASAYRKAGLLTMFPSLRGGNDNPGVKEGFLGEVDDVLAAAKYLESRPEVDPKRIYLGGHSTGGTLALLVAQMGGGFRSVFSFGPVANVAGYGSDSGFLPFDLDKRQEVKLRSPGYWLSSLKAPTWVIEGAGSSNVEDLRSMAASCNKGNVHFLEVKGSDHFATLAPINALIAKKIVLDIGPECNINISPDEINQAYRDQSSSK